MRLSTLLTFAFVLAACGARPGSDDASTASRAQAILGGTSDTADQGVVLIISNAKADNAELCSGYLITPTLVLTARHCTGEVIGGTTSCPRVGASDAGVVDAGSPDAASDGGAPPDGPDRCGAAFAAAAFDVYDTQDYFAGTRHAAARVINPPGSDGAPMCGLDVSVLELESPLSGTPIAPRLDLPPIPGESLTLVGYGTDGAKRDSQGDRRSLSGAVVSHVGELVASSGHTYRETANDFAVDRGPCGGDSGSPAIDVAGRSIGVMSRGMPTICADMVYTQVAPFADWLRAVATDAAKRAGTAAPAWVTRPADGSAHLGDDCSSASQCEAGLSCLPLDTRFRCTSTDCGACAPGWTCGTSAGSPACVPDPNAQSDAGTDDAAAAGAPDAAVAPGATTTTKSGCGVASGAPSDAGALVFGLALTALVATRARRRDSRYGGCH